jgi:hypothetical protein
MKIRKVIFLGLFLIAVNLIWILGFYGHHAATMNSIQKTDTIKVIHGTHPILEKIRVPNGMQTLKAWQHTSVIGTPDHPTLDGGIINANDGLPIYQPPPPKPVDVKQEAKNPSEHYHAFSDNWVTSSHLKAVLEKAAQSGKLGYVLKESDKKGLPASVVLLPIVESRYQDSDVSPKGAVGSWQLMPETARENGLLPENRTQFVPSTKAALTLLDNLHQQFGSWELAFAAYNAGSSRVQKALLENPNATSIAALNLPVETKNYVLAIQRMSQILTTQENTGNGL